MPRPHCSPVVLVVLVGTLVSATSRATPPETLERARRLFLQGEADEDDNRWSEALDKFRAVSLVKLTAGVRYHIALCEERLGRLALALKDYRAAEEQAKVDNAKDVLRTVGRDLAALEPRVPTLIIRVSPQVANVLVKLDGEPIGDATNSAPVPVDPGVHYVEVRAPDRPTSTQAVVLQERESRTLEVAVGAMVPSGARQRSSETVGQPPTSSATAPATTPASASAPSNDRSRPSAESMALAPPHTHREPAVIATAFSVGLAGGGVVAFLVSGNALDHAVRTCSLVVAQSRTACDSLKEPVWAWDWVAAGAWVAALAAGSVAVVLWTKHPEVSAPSAHPANASISLMLGPTTFGAGGQF